MKAEVADLLGKAEAADQAEVPDGMQVPEELARREKRLAEIARAKAVIEARAKERHAREQAEYEAKMAARGATAAQTGKKPGGRVPQPPVEGPLPTDQVNLTDEKSRIMPVAGGGFEQCYNAQAAVAADSLLVVAADVVQAPNDKQQLEPMLGKIAELPAELGKVGELLADNGYFSEGNVNACAAAGIEPVIAMGREALVKFGHPVTFEQARSQIGKGGDQLFPVFLSEADQRDHGRRWRKGVGGCLDRSTFVSCGHSRRSRSCCAACVKLA